MEDIQDKVENKIIDWIALDSGARLVAQKPEKGADLIVQKKGDYPAKQIFLKVRILEGDISENQEKLPENYYLLFVNFDFIKQKINEKFWLFPDFKEQITREIFINFLIDKLILENKTKIKEGFKNKKY